MLRVVRLVAAAALLTVAVAWLGVAGAGSADPIATLQLVPRGPGTVAASPVGTDTATNAAVQAPCAESEEPGQCRWTYPAGTAVTLTAAPAAGASFAGWSAPECGGASGAGGGAGAPSPTCRVALDAGVVSVFALFSPLTVHVLEPALGRIVGPGGIDCPDVRCEAPFPARAKVQLTYIGPSFRRWEFGCAPADQPTCTVDVLHQPTWVGVRIQNQEAPQHPDVVTVRLRVRKTGDGSGTVSATGTRIDCGSACDTEVSEEDTVALRAAADTGSVRGGWGGVCPDTDATCTVAVAAFSLVTVTFGKEAAPSVPGDLALRAAGRTSLAFAWQPSTDDTGIAGYEVALDGGTPQQVAAATTAVAFTRLACGSAHAVTVVARDTAGNRSAPATLAASTAACPLVVRTVRVTVTRRGRTREVIALLRASVPTSGEMTLVRGRRVVARQVLRPRAGQFRVRLVVPRSVPRGRALARVVLRDTGGATFRLERTVTLP